MPRLVHVRLLSVLAAAIATVVVADLLMDALSAFVDVSGMAEDAKTILQLADDVKHNRTSGVPAFDNTFPLSSQELGLLFQLYDKCGTSESQALLTWCTGMAPNGTMVDGEQLCPPGVRTHPCTGRVLDVGRDADHVQFLWPWQGIKCDAFTDPTTITNIYLPGEGLKCRLQDLDFSYMVSLEQLDLSQNELHGPFPSWLGNMTLLRFLNLRENQITSNLPLSLGDNIAIEVIDLAHNHLTAPSLSFFNIFKRLRYLDLSGNQFNLTLPSGFFGGNYLEHVNLSHNAFHGPLPRLPTLKQLVSFDVSHNAFEGELPRRLATWGRSDPDDPTEDPITELLDFSYNRFTGSIPPLLNQSSLLRFAVQSNRLSGVLPQLPVSLFSSQTPRFFEGNDFLCPLPQMTPTPGNFGKLTCICKNGRRTQGSESFINRTRARIMNRVAASQVAVECTVCPDGSYSNATTEHQCVKCPLGHIPNRTSSVTENDGATECVACASGTIANVTGSVECTKCPPGAIAKTSGLSACSLCFPGEFIDVPGSTACKPCPSGSAAHRSGSAECQLCQPGTYSAFKGEFTCLPCPRGQFQDQAGATSCHQCPPGYVAPLIGQKLCQPCHPGTYFNSTTRHCAKCPPNTFTDGDAQLQCRYCEDGTATDGYGNFKCERCAAPGFGRGQNQSVEEACLPGFFNNGSAVVCQPCPPGAFAGAPRATRCELCRPGTFSDTLAARTCTLAPVGTFVGDLGAWRPARCSPGQYADVEGSISCRPCPENTSSVFGGRAQCEPLVDGEVLQAISWPQAELSLVGIDASNLQSNQTLQDELLTAWRLAQIANGISRVEPHIVDVVPSSGRALVQMVLEILPPPPSRIRPAGGLFSGLQNAYDDATDIAQETTDSATQWFQKLTGKVRSVVRAGHANVTEVIPSAAFTTSLSRQLSHAVAPELRAAASLLITQLSVSPFEATRAIRCPRGSFFTIDTASGERRCVLCPVGTYADMEGVLEQCEPCHEAHFSAREGAEICDVCPWGQGAERGASTCQDCGFLSRACGDFWNNVLLTSIAGVATVLTAWRRSRELWGSGTAHKVPQLQSESAALVAAVRTFGRAPVRP